MNDDLLNHDEPPEVHLEPPVLQGTFRVGAPARRQVAVDDVRRLAGVGAHADPARGIVIRGGDEELARVQSRIDFLADQNCFHALSGNLHQTRGALPRSPVAGAIDLHLIPAHDMPLLALGGGRQAAQQRQCDDTSGRSLSLRHGVLLPTAGATGRR